MKIFKNTLIIMTVAGILTLILGFIFNGDYLRMAKVYAGYENLEKQDLLYLEETDKLEIDITSRNINVYITDGASYIEYYLDLNNEKMEFSNNKFKISQKKLFNFGFNFNNFDSMRVNVYINTEINELGINLKSGILTISDIIELNSLKIRNTSGLINLDNVRTNNANIINTSGNIKINNLTALNSTIKNTSGFITINNSRGSKINVTNTSGGIKFNNNEFMDNTLQTTSGSIKVTDLREDSIIGIKASVTSGSIKIYNKSYKEYDNTNSSKLINYLIKVTSGNITFSN